MTSGTNVALDLDTVSTGLAHLVNGELVTTGKTFDVTASETPVRSSPSVPLPMPRWSTARSPLPWLLGPAWAADEAVSP